MAPLSNFKRNCLSLAVAQAIALPMAQAATITVDSVGDVSASDNICTLREAVASANSATIINNGCGHPANSGADEIVFHSDLYGNTITLSQATDLPVTEALTITGPGQTQLTINGGNNQTVFVVASASLDISALTISGGSTTGDGGAINADSSTVTLTDCTLTGNNAAGNGGGISAYSSSVSLSNSTVSGNSAGYDGGGINSFSFDDSVSLSNSTSSVSLSNSTVSGNSAGDNGGGISTSFSSVSLSNSTVSGNSAGNDGGGISAYSSSVSLSNSTVSGNSAGDNGGGIYAFNSTVSLSNSTVSGNSAGDDGGGIYAFNSTVSLSNSTVSGNSAGDNGGGIYADYSTVSLSNSIVLGNLAPANPEISGSVTLIGNNLTTGNAATVLAPLADNGGPTETHALVVGSPAINGGDQAVCTANNILTDQRGVERDNTCDIGAYEFEDDETCFVVKAANGKVLVFCI